MPHMRITGLPVNDPKLLDDLETQLAQAAANDPALDLNAENFRVFYCPTTPTARSGEVVLVEILPIFEKSERGKFRTVATRNALIVRLAQVLTAFCRQHAPTTKQLHFLCPEYTDRFDAFTVVDCSPPSTG